MYEMSKCECGEELEFDEDVDVRIDGDIAALVSVVHCPKCNKKYKWKDVYILTDFNDLEETE
jgi:hypothetical protein